MKKLSIGMVIFTGIFVGVVTFFAEYLIPDVHIIKKVITAGMSALVGGLLGSKLFPSNEVHQ